MLLPAAKEKLILGLLEGNHELRITKTTGINITKVLCKLLKVRYLGSACWNLFSVNGTRHSVYALHGTSGSRFKHTKLKAVVDTCGWIESDIIAMGHVHSLASEPIIKEHFDAVKNKIISRKQWVVLTGSYLEWDGSYAQSHNLPITNIGSPTAKLYAGKKDISITLG